MMNAQELETAVRLQLDLVVLVLQDDAPSADDEAERRTTTCTRGARPTP
jgi:thiamine pyrophosphate-dependent acetolactate synthase large subunit-like protein